MTAGPPAARVAKRQATRLNVRIFSTLAGVVCFWFTHGFRMGQRTVYAEGMAKRPTIFIEVSPLLDYHWTGIAVVTKKLAQYFIECVRDKFVFFSGTHIVDKNYVANAIRKSPGGYLHTLINSGFAKLGTLTEELSDCSFSFGIYVDRKSFHNVFDHETSIVHTGDVVHRHPRLKSIRDALSEAVTRSS